MANVFISYSRKDIEAALKLAEACKAQELDVWIDQEGIEPTVDWWKEIEKGIEGADNFLFLISPDSVISPICQREVEHAVRNGKRLIPVVVRNVPTKDAPDVLRALNWIFLRETDDFPTTVRKLVTAVRTDYDWVQTHRRLQVRALEWERGGRENSFLLRGKDLQAAEAQLSVNSSKEPYPTDLQRDYVLKSRQASDRQRRLLVSLSTGAAVIMAVLAVFGFVQANLANERARIARARELAALGLAEDQPIRSLLFSVEAFQRLDDQAQRNSLLTGLQASPSLNTILHGHGATVWTAAFSPDGNTLAAGATNGTVTLWDVSNPSHPLQLGDPLDSHTEDVWSVAFSPDGNTLAAGTVGHTIVLWDVSNPEVPRQIGKPLEGHLEDVRSVVFSPDGSTLASSGCGNTNDEGCIQGEIILWDVSDLAAPSTLGQPLSAHTNDVWSLAFRRDGKTLASASADATIILWNVSDLRAPMPLGTPFGNHIAPIRSVVFSPDGETLASGSWDRTVNLWDVSTPTEPIQHGEPLKSHEAEVWSVAFSLDGKTLAVGGTDDRITLWDVSTLEAPVQLDLPLAGHTNNILSLVFSPDGKTLASGSFDQTVILWDLSNLTPPLQIGSVLHLQDFAWSMAFNVQGDLMASGGWGTILLWDVSNPEAPQPLGRPLDAHKEDVRTVTFSPDGRTLASASCGKTNGTVCIEGEIILWDVSSPESPVPLGMPLRGHTNMIQSLALSTDGKTLASGSWDQTVLLWDISDVSHPVPLGEPLQGYPAVVRSVALSPDGKTLAASGDDLSIRFWDISNPAEPISLGELPVRHTSYVWSLAFSPDGETLASGSIDESVILWDVSDPRAPFQFSEPLRHPNVVVSVAFSPDGRMLASTSCGASDDTRTCTQGDILLWDVSNPVAAIQLGRPLSGHTNDAIAVTFSPDSRFLASSSLDGSIILWDVDPQSWANHACQKVGRNFTNTEWARYFPEEEYHATCTQWSSPLEEHTPIP